MGREKMIDQNIAYRSGGTDAGSDADFEAAKGFDSGHVYAEAEI
jgi:hypothetical protein